jgi:starch-binding outer membrane protein, SusD/RagB family
MKKYNIHLLLFLLVFLFAQGCQKELLDKKPLALISDAVVWDDPALTGAYLTNLYGRITTLAGLYATNWNTYDDANVYFSIVASGEGCSNLPWNKTLIGQGLLNGSGGELEYFDYAVLRDINIFLINLEKGNNTEDLKTQFNAQARFLRAFVYFEMVKRYGGVPIILTPQSIDADSATLFVKRNKEQEVYDLIGHECDTLAGILPSTDDPGRITKYAALALKSRAMLYAASIAKYGTLQLDGLVGIPASDANKYWQASLDASKEIMDDGRFSLFDKYPDKSYNYQMIFLEKDNSEVILAKKFFDINYGHSWDDFENPNCNYTYWGCTFSPSMQMVDSYDMLDGSDGTIDWANLKGSLRSVILQKDPRCEASIMYNGTPWLGSRDTVALWKGTYTESGEKLLTEFTSYNGRDVVGLDETTFQRPSTGFLLKKFLDPTHKFPITNSSYQDWLVFRYAEILLNYAEASFELNGVTAENLDAINQIRDRAGVATLPAVTLDKIRHERRIELAFEEHTFYDLRRWRIAEAELNTNRLAAFAYWHFDTAPNQFEYEVSDAEDFNRVFKTAYYYLPIGEARINNNPNLKENPGY